MKNTFFGFGSGFLWVTL